jgi:hypothetical protein
MINSLIDILKEDKESYTIRSPTATSIGNIIHKRNHENIKKYILRLKEPVNEKNNIFVDHISNGAISGIAKLSDNEDDQVTDFLVLNSDDKSSNTNMIRQAATLALGNFVIKSIQGKI